MNASNLNEKEREGVEGWGLRRFNEGGLIKLHHENTEKEVPGPPWWSALAPKRPYRFLSRLFIITSARFSKTQRLKDRPNWFLHNISEQRFSLRFVALMLRCNAI